MHISYHCANVTGFHSLARLRRFLGGNHELLHDGIPLIGGGLVGGVNWGSSWNRNPFSHQKELSDVLIQNEAMHSTTSGHHQHGCRSVVHNSTGNEFRAFLQHVLLRSHAASARGLLIDSKDSPQRHVAVDVLRSVQGVENHLVPSGIVPEDDGVTAFLTCHDINLMAVRHGVDQGLIGQHIKLAHHSPSKASSKGASKACAVHSLGDLLRAHLNGRHDVHNVCHYFLRVRSFVML
mmetsp:Transcript_16119/g.31502  ORF Transcript_16119/g.31502 Transcript_16119/m.31502 type:complete len:236 (+) Transcript_16119:507-1214(+)